MLGMGVVTVEGTISESPAVRSVTTLSGQSINVASFRIRDETGQVKASFWRDLAETVRDLPEGTRIRVEAAYVKEGLDGTPELSSGAVTQVKILSKPSVKSKK
jgi:ssDNA-binding replication factor A large subunit